MKILHRDYKEGRVKVMPESLDDLWYLKGIIAEGDTVYGTSFRRIRDDEKLRADKGVRVPVHIGIVVSRTEFAAYITRLRVSGKIIEGPEDLISYGTFHTIEIKPRDVVSIKKVRWQKWEAERLKEAEKSAKTPIVLILCIEDGEAEFAVVRRYGIDYVARVTTTVSGKWVEKEHETTMKEFFDTTAGKLVEVLKKEEIKFIIICGPGFTKENLFNFLKSRHPKIAGICRVEGAGTGGRVGIQEIIKRGIVEKIVEESRISIETMLVERVFEEIGRGTMLAAYGMDDVRNALELGAVEKLLISDRFLRKCSSADKFIEKTRAMRGEPVIVSTEHEAGERLESIGGIAAILRFRISDV